MRLQEATLDWFVQALPREAGELVSAEGSLDLSSKFAGLQALTLGWLHMMTPQGGGYDRPADSPLATCVGEQPPP